MKLNPLTAAAAAAAIVAGATVLVFSHVPGLLVWAAFIGWASYDQSGASRQAALRSSAALVFGVVMAWAVAISVAYGTLPLSVPQATAVAAAVASFLIVIASRLPLLSVVPATFYGFASTFAYASIVPGAFAAGAAIRLDAQSPLLIVPASLLIGTGLGVAHGKLAALLAAGRSDAVPARAVRLPRYAGERGLMPPQPP